MNTQYPRTDKMMMDDLLKHRELLKVNAPKIYQIIQMRKPIKTIAITKPGDQLPSSKDHVDQEPILNTTTDRGK